jgi:starch synthase (maltosyl-transferring)
MLHENAQARVIISGVTPEIDGGRFPVKRTVGEKLIVEAGIFVDGHDLLSAVLLYRAETEARWREAVMRPLVNDCWRGEFRVTAVGVYFYTLQAWVDRFTSWREGFRKKVEANQDVKVGRGAQGDRRGEPTTPTVGGYPASTSGQRDRH